MFTRLTKTVARSVQRWFAGSRPPHGRGAGSSRRAFLPALEELEGRAVPSSTALTAHPAGTASHASVISPMPPVVTSATPSGLTTNPTIRVTFSQPIVPATFTTADVSLTAPNGKTVSSTSVKSVTPVAGSHNESFTIQLANLTTAGTYTLGIGSSAKNAAGIAVTPYKTTFTIVAPVVTGARTGAPASKPLAAPVVTSARTGALTGSPFASIQVTFSQPLVPSTFTAADVSLTGPKGTVKITSVTPVAGSGNKTFTIAFALQTTPGAYTLKIGPNAWDAAGVRVRAYQTTFTILAPPVVTSARANGLTTSSFSTIQVTFSQPIVPSTFTAADVSLTGPNGAVKITSVTPVGGSGNKTFTIAFTSPAAAGTYTLKIGPNATNAAGVAVTAYQTTFAIGAPPAVTSATANSLTSGSFSSIQVTFSEAIVPSTFTPADVSLTGPGGAVKITSVTPVSGSGNKSFTIAFSNATAAGNYTLKIGASARNTSGVPVAAYQTTFTVTATPAVTGATAGGLTTGSFSSIQVTFNQPIAPASLTPADVTLTGPAGGVAITAVTPVAGSNNETFTIAFAAPSTAGSYTLTVGPGVQSMAGVAVPTYQTAFTIVAPPVVTGTTGNGPANSLSSIQVTFSQPIVPSTFTTADLNLVGPNGAVAIASVTPVANSNNESFVILFADQTAPGTYTLSIGPKATNAAGVAVTPDQATFTVFAPVDAHNFTGLLLPGHSIASPDGQYVLTLQADGNLVEQTAAGVTLWSSGTGGQTVTQMVMQSDGNLVLYNGGTSVWATNTAGNPGAYLNVQDNGDLVIFSGTAPIWTSNTAQPVTLLPGQSLSSPNGQYVLTLQLDGNLVEYNQAGTALWASGTQGKGVTEMLMQGDGNLVLYDGTTAVWASNTGGNPGAYLDVQNIGNVVIYSGTTPIWTAQPTTLLPGQFISSPNGQYVLTLQADGNLVEYNAAGTPLWASGTQGKGVTEMLMQGDGNLVLYSGGTAVWASNTAGNPGASLSLQNNGDLVIESGTTPIWSAPLTLQQNGILLPGEAISSPNGQYFLVLQADGNLVKYNSSGTPMWASGTAGMTVTQLVMQSDGNLVLYNGGTPVWASNTNGNPGAYLSLGNNGSLTITAANGTTLWTM
jgi:methionine-rich copper-binding protein CopC